MKFKKGDYVRGIDSLTNICYTGRIIDIEYKLTDWASYCIDTVWGNKWLINDTIKKVEGENEMTFKKGDIVEVIERDYSGGKAYEVGSRWEVLHEDNNNKGKPLDLVYVKDETRPNGRAALFTSNVKKVDEQPDELMIPISLVYQVLASEPTNREIKAFLKGYKEGLKKKNC